MTAKSPSIVRHTTHAVAVGPVLVGGAAPIVVQSMTNTDTADVEATVRKVTDLARAYRVTEETIRRDLDKLEREGRLRRSHGGAVPVAEEEREAMVRELETKNAELERFTYTVSHDLKSPLVTIRGFLGLLERDAAAGRQERMERDVEKIRGATETMGRLLDELLELSRIGRLVNPPQEVDLAELAGEAAAQLAGAIATRRARLEIAADLPVVLGDRIRLLEVLQNLIDNALKFGGDEREPRVEVGLVPCTATDAPRSARCAAMTRPMPRDEPVTQATLPDRRFFSMCVSSCIKNESYA